MTLRLASITACLALLASCGAYYTPVSFVAQGDQIIASGTIDETTLSAFEEVTAQNPEARTLVLQYIEGSVDDDANVIFAREVHRAGFDTVVPSNGLVASGGTDLFWPETAACCNRGPVSVSTAGPGRVWWRPTCPRTIQNMTDTGLFQGYRRGRGVLLVHPVRSPGRQYALDDHCRGEPVRFVHQGCSGTWVCDGLRRTVSQPFSKRAPISLTNFAATIAVMP